jgi:His-Xaa-Ser system radical SAM maturase HxsC
MDNEEGLDDGRTITYLQEGKKCVTRTICFKCNNRCISCITDFLEHKNNPTLTMDQIKEIINNIDKEAETIDFNGGEPTLRKDFFDILLYTNKMLPNTTIQLLTNARMFSYLEYMNSFIKLNIKNINFFASLYGHNSKVHDAITRAPGSFAQTVKGIKNLLNSGQNVEVRVIINKINYKYLKEIAEFILANFSNAFRVVFVNMKFTGEAYKNRNLVFIDYSSVSHFAQQAVDILKDRMNVRLYHFPLCIIDEFYWDYAKGTTIPDDQITFGEDCAICSKRGNCAGVWSSYARIAGFREFKPIKG